VWRCDSRCLGHRAMIFSHRHYACGAASQTAVCTVFRGRGAPLVYLSASGVDLSRRLAVWLCMVRVRQTRRVRRAGRRAIFGGVLCGIAACCRALSMTPCGNGRSTWAQPSTGAPIPGSRGTRAGRPVRHGICPIRRSIRHARGDGRRTTQRGAPETYSNPYIEWQSRNRLNTEYLAAAQAPAGLASRRSATCSRDYKGANAYVILRMKRPSRRRHCTGLRWETNTIYRVTAAACIPREMRPRSSSCREA